MWKIPYNNDLAGWDFIDAQRILYSSRLKVKPLSKLTDLFGKALSLPLAVANSPA